MKLYCVNVAKCTNAREGEYVAEEEVFTLESYPNPFTNQTTVKFNGYNANIKVYNPQGVLIIDTLAQEEYQFGANLDKGIYLIKTTTKGNTETIRVIKE